MYVAMTQLLVAVEDWAEIKIPLMHSQEFVLRAADRGYWAVRSLSPWSDVQSCMQGSAATWIINFI